MINLFKTAFIQVFLVSVNTIFLTKAFVPGIAIFTWLISYMWVTNVKKANIATRLEQYIYATGAMGGGLSGFYFTKIFVG